jgi:hypothetical protein
MGDLVTQGAELPLTTQSRRFISLFDTIVE